MNKAEWLILGISIGVITLGIVITTSTPKNTKAMRERTFKCQQQKGQYKLSYNNEIKQYEETCIKTKEIKITIENF